MVGGILASVKVEQARIPLGRGSLEAEPMTSAAGDHAILIREADTPRVLLLAERGPAESLARERVVVMPFDEDVETRVDGDALAKWIAAVPGGSGDAGLGARAGSTAIPGWASAIGLALLLLLVVLVVIGGAVTFSWLLDLLAGSSVTVP